MLLVIFLFVGLIPDLPESERPRERLARLGGGALSDAELLAIFLRVGVKGSSAIEVGRRLLAKHGSLSELGGLSVRELSLEHGLGAAKAAQLLAAFELGARCASEKVEREPMNAPGVIYKLAAPRLAHQRVEHVLLYLLDVKLRVVRTVELSVGNEDCALCVPRDVLHQVLIHRASCFVLVHNHPSGDPSPSKADVSLTRDLRDAARLMAVRMVDHLIVGRPSSADRGYYSFAEAGELD